MRALFDVSVLLALVDRAHVHHDRVGSWWARERQDGWASCPLTQNGFVRIISQPSYLRPRRTSEAITLLRHATERPEHEFWPDDLSILDAGTFDHRRVLGPRQITDVYLLALATKHGGRFVTLDGALSIAPVKGATPGNLVIL